MKKEKYIRLPEVQKSKFVLKWLINLAKTRQLSMEDVIDILERINKNNNR